jgi:hypothetical protein
VSWPWASDRLAFLLVDARLVASSPARRRAAPSSVMLGLRNRENLLVDDQARWLGHYVPAFRARRYPFVLAQLPGQSLEVCLGPWRCPPQPGPGVVAASGTGHASTLSMRRPSRSTTSNTQSPQVMRSPVSGRLPDTAISRPASVL